MWSMQGRSARQSLPTVIQVFTMIAQIGFLRAHFKEEMRLIFLTVVGELPSAMMEAYVNEVRDRLTELEGVKHIVTKR